MEAKKVKNISFYIILPILACFCLTVILGIWGLIDGEIAFKISFSLGAIIFSILLFVVLHDKMLQSENQK